MQLNTPCLIELLADKPAIGKSAYGDYFLYSVRNGDGKTEQSYFAPSEVHEQLKSLKKGSKVSITKLAEQKGTKIVTHYDVRVLSGQSDEPTKQNNPSQNESENPIQESDNLFELMLLSCRDAVRIQQELGGLMDPKSIAVTLFIARSKVNGFGGSI